MPPNTRTLKGQSYCSQRWANPAWPKGSKSRGFSTRHRLILLKYPTTKHPALTYRNTANSIRRNTTVKTFYFSPYRFCPFHEHEKTPRHHSTRAPAHIRRRQRTAKNTNIYVSGRKIRPKVWPFRNKYVLLHSLTERDVAQLVSARVWGA